MDRETITKGVFKACKLEVKDNGSIEGYMCIWNHPDSVGDRFIRGAFSKSCREKVAAGKVMLRSTHLSSSRNIFKNIGVITEAEEDEIGCRIKADLFDNTEAQELRNMVAKAPNAFGLSTGSIPLRTLNNELGGTDFLENILMEVTVASDPMDEATLGLKAASESAEDTYAKAVPTDHTALRNKRSQEVRRIILERIKS